MLVNFFESADENAILVPLLKDPGTKEIFLGLLLQAKMMSKWNLSWLFFDIMFESDFHQHTRKTKSIKRESSASGMMLSQLGGITLRMDGSNMVEVWIIGTWSAFGMLYLW